MNASNDHHGRLDMGTRTLAMATQSSMLREVYSPRQIHHIEPPEAQDLPAEGDTIFAFANVAYHSGIQLSTRVVKVEARDLPAVRPTLLRSTEIDSMDDDRGLGACVLRRPELAQIVADSLVHFDGDRYRMGDFVVMPNHVHLLAAFPAPKLMEQQFASWMRFTATKINRELKLKGHFWQQEPFDHLVRSPDQYQYLREYIADNPRKAGLQCGEYYYHKYVG